MNDNQALLPVDKISMAVAFAHALRQKAEACDATARETALNGVISKVVLDTLVPILPWLGRFNIVKYGNPLHWECIDTTVIGSRVVTYMKPELAEQQVRDWVLERVDEIEQAIIIERMTAE